jgi:hypothetical protein
MRSPARCVTFGARDVSGGHDVQLNLFLQRLEQNWYDDDPLLNRLLTRSVSLAAVLREASAARLNRC